MFSIWRSFAEMIMYSLGVNKRNPPNKESPDHYG